MKLYFATTNDYKVQEVQAIMKEFGINVEKIGLDKREDKEREIEEVAVLNAETFAAKHSIPVVVEDTGFFFHAHPKFPGSSPKLAFSQLGYNGLMKLLHGEQDRGAEFRSAVAFSHKGMTKLFVGTLKGWVPEQPQGMDINVMPYERIFIPEGHDKALAFLTRAEKNKISHRANAFRQLAAWLAGKEAPNGAGNINAGALDAGADASTIASTSTSANNGHAIIQTGNGQLQNDLNQENSQPGDSQDANWEPHGDVY